MKKIIILLILIIFSGYVNANFVSVTYGEPYNFSLSAVYEITGTKINSTDISIIYTKSGNGYPYISTLKYNYDAENITRMREPYNYDANNSIYIGFAQAAANLFISLTAYTSLGKTAFKPILYDSSIYNYSYAAGGIIYPDGTISSIYYNQLLKINSTYMIGQSSKDMKAERLVVFNISGTTLASSGAYVYGSLDHSYGEDGFIQIDYNHFLLTTIKFASEEVYQVFELNRTNNTFSKYTEYYYYVGSIPKEHTLIKYNQSIYISIFLLANGLLKTNIFNVNNLTWSVSRINGPNIDSSVTTMTATYLGNNYFGIYYNKLNQGKFTILYYNATAQTLSINGEYNIIDSLNTLNYYASSRHLFNLNNNTLIVVYKGDDDFAYALPLFTEEYDSKLTISVKNSITQEYITELNITVTNGTYTETQFINGTYNATFYLNASTYNISVTKINDDLGIYITTTVEYNLSADVEDSTIINMSVYSLFNLYDEKTAEAFNLSSADLITLVTYCTDTTNLLDITNTTTLVLFDCNFEKIKVVVEYPDTTYYRTFLYSSSDLSNISIYLIDLSTTQAIYNSFSIEDLLGNYNNPSIYVKKIINSETEIITSDYIDIENKIGAYLIENHQYIVEIHSDNQPVLVLGDYSADISGDKTLSLTEVTIMPVDTTNFENNVYWWTGLYNDSGTIYVRGRYIDLGNLTTSVTFYVWRDEFNGTVLYSSNVVGDYDITWLWNATAYENYTLVGGFYISHPELSAHWVAKTVQVVEDIILGIEGYLNPQTLNWFITLLLGTVALMATIKTANYVSMLLIGGAGLFVMFGWFHLSMGVLAIAGLVSLLSLLRSGSDGSVT